MPNPFSKFAKNEDGAYMLYDRFSFDRFFRILLRKGFDHDEAVGFIMSNCALSALVFQERIHNKDYLEISSDESTSGDLIALRERILSESLRKKIEEVL